ncbi:hypothetical protein Patl1_24692 [Pistacia atlantica]|uniref:Uncharacterized protein n=1 Tax=Pistacia atlantica TaxID=434234 RepID=A0ACC1AYU8_9ROSI|nr:hypothetical protein Patl1_24692 [Pistacia atlantica]
MTDTLSAALTYSFLRKWLMAHPKFLKNQLYLAGDSYSGKIVPMIVQEISEGLDAGIEPILNLKGYVLGNPVTDENKDINSRIQFSYLKALITHEIYESAKMNCKGEYINVDPSNGLCKADLQNVTTCTQNLYLGNILEPDCSIDASPKPKLLNWHRSIFMEQDFSDSLLSPTRPPTPCGDLDLAIPYVGTETWIKSLNLTIDSGWQPWSVEGQVAGYWMRYIESIYSLTYATGGGHTAPEYKPKECLAMISRFVADLTDQSISVIVRTSAPSIRHESRRSRTENITSSG